MRVEHLFSTVAQGGRAACGGVNPQTVAPVAGTHTHTAAFPLAGPLTRHATVTHPHHTMQTSTHPMHTTTAHHTTPTGTLYAAKAQLGRDMGQQARQVLAAVRRHPAGISSVGIVGELGDDAPDNLAKTLANLRQLGHIVNAGTRGAASRWVCASQPPATPKAAAHKPGGGLAVPVNKTAERAAIEDVLMRAGEAGATRGKLMAFTGLPDDVVHKVCKNLCAASKAELVSPHGGERYYVLVAAAARAQAHSKAQAAGPRTAQPIRTNKMAGTYDPVELRPNPGITPDRFVAFCLPSRIGNRLHFPDGRVKDMPA